MKFFNKNPSRRNEDSNYKNALQKTLILKITNDISERTISLTENFNRQITNNEEQFQCLFQLVR